MDISKKIASEIEVKVSQVDAAIKLLDEGCTVPFISRYRKEATGSLNDEQLRKLSERLEYLRGLDERRDTILKSIDEQGKLTKELKKQINDAETMVALEDIYRPYKPKKKTRGVIAKEKGLEPLAKKIMAEDMKQKMETYAKKYIAYNFNNKLMTGTSTTEFSPNETLSRAMLITLLYKLDGATNTAKNYFTDVEEGTWYTDAVAWAAANKIVSGVSATEFAPHKNITREEMAAMIKNYSDYKKYDTSKRADLSKFVDAKGISSWAIEAIKWANAEGIINGTNDSRINPENTATRAEAATLITKYIINFTK